MFLHLGCTHSASLRSFPRALTYKLSAYLNHSWSMSFLWDPLGVQTLEAQKDNVKTIKKRLWNIIIFWGDSDRILRGLKTFQHACWWCCKSLIAVGCILWITRKTCLLQKCSGLSKDQRLKLLDSVPPLDPGACAQANRTYRLNQLDICSFQQYVEI